jgi:hypothetical protein
MNGIFIHHERYFVNTSWVVFIHLNGTCSVYPEPVERLPATIDKNITIGGLRPSDAAHHKMAYTMNGLSGFRGLTHPTHG